LTSEGNSKGKTSAPGTITLAEALVAHPNGFEASKLHIDELPHTLPENAMDIGQQDSVKTGVGSIFLGESFESIPTNENFLVPKYFQKVPSKESQMFKNSVKALMQQHFQFTNKVNKRVQPSLKDHLKDHLQSCCRKHGRQILPETSAVTYHSDPFLPPDDLGSESEHVAAFYSIEEKAHEAVVLLLELNLWGGL
jgi:hypothetical protein